MKTVKSAMDNRMVVGALGLGCGLLLGWMLLCKTCEVCEVCGPTTVLSPSKLETKVVETTKQTYTTDNMVPAS